MDSTSTPTSISDEQSAIMPSDLLPKMEPPYFIHRVKKINQYSTYFSGNNKKCINYRPKPP